MTSKRLERPDNLAECHALLDAQQQVIEEKLRYLHWLQARAKRMRRKRKKRAPEFYSLPLSDAAAKCKEA